MAGTAMISDLRRRGQSRRRAGGSMDGPQLSSLRFLTSQISPEIQANGRRIQSALRCGLVQDLPAGHFIVNTQAVRDEDWHYRCGRACKSCRRRHS